MTTKNEVLAVRLEKIATDLEETQELDEQEFQDVDCGEGLNTLLSDAYDAWYDCDEEDVDDDSGLVRTLCDVAEMLRRADREV